MPPGAHHAASGSRYAGSTQVVCSVRIQAPSRQLDRRSQRRRRAPSLDLAAELARLGQRFADHPLAVDVEQCDQRVGRRGVVGEPAAPERDVRPHVLRHPTLQRRPHPPTCLLQTQRWRQSEADRTEVTMGCQPVQRQRWASSAWRTVASVGSVRAATRMMIPGVQKPHWLPPLAQNDSRPAVGAVEPLDRRDRRVRRRGRRA